MANRHAKATLIIIVLYLCMFTPLEARSPWTGSDKPMHFLGSAYLVYWNYHWGSEVLGCSPTESLIFSVSITSFIGTGKELSDRYYKKTRFSWHDMAYNVAGIALGIVIIEATK